MSLLSALGDTEWVAKEGLIDSVTAISGSGPAYLFLFAEALTAAGIAEGLPPKQAEKFARATVSGAGALLAADKTAAAKLREAVTSPAGTTAAALSVFMANDALLALVKRAAHAAKMRAEELRKTLTMAGLRAGHPEPQTPVFVALDGRVKPAHGVVLVPTYPHAFRCWYNARDRRSRACGKGHGRGRGEDGLGEQRPRLCLGFGAISTAPCPDWDRAPSDRQPDDRLQAAQRAVAQHDIPAMGAGDVAGDGQAQARTADLQVAAFVQAVEGTEGFLAPGFGNALAIVFHRDLHAAAVAATATPPPGCHASRHCRSG